MIANVDQPDSLLVLGQVVQDQYFPDLVEQFLIADRLDQVPVGDFTLLAQQPQDFTFRIIVVHGTNKWFGGWSLRTLPFDNLVVGFGCGESRARNNRSKPSGMGTSGTQLVPT